MSGQQRERVEFALKLLFGQQGVDLMVARLAEQSHLLALFARSLAFGALIGMARPGDEVMAGKG